MNDDIEIRKEIVALLPRLRRFGVSLTGNQDDADDLVQSAVEKAIRRLDSWQRGTRLDSWIFRIMHNAWIDQHRQKKVRGVSVDIDEVIDLAGDDGRRVAQFRDDFSAVREAIDRLPATQRSVVMLALVEGRSYRETAEILDVSEGTVMSRIARARRALRRVLEEPGDEETQDVANI
ncbi:MAG: RNA polymerase sigma factor [Pseudomonadota bacterium]